MTRLLVITLLGTAALACSSPESSNDRAAPPDALDMEEATGADLGAPDARADAADEEGEDAPDDLVDMWRGDMSEDEEEDPWAPVDGRWGAPTRTFTLPEPEQGDGLYVPDVQDRYPDVDWSTLERLYIPAGHYKFLRLGNLPERDPADPLVITNKGGQVRIGGLDHHYVCVLSGGSGWVLTGRYDPISATGDAAFPGHRGGAFANSQGRYGILIDDAFMREGGSGLGIGGGATRFEVESLEITRVGFAGMLIKTDDDEDATMEDVFIHDTYVHDVGSEGYYIGSTQQQPQHTIRGLRIINNRVLRTGTEAIQLGQLAGRNEVHHNVFGPSAIDWRDAFQAYQDGNFQISIRGGDLDVHHNIFLGGASNQVALFGNVVQGDATDENVGVTLRDNFFGYTRNLGMYINKDTPAGMRYTIARNVWTGWRFERDEVHSDAPERDHLLRVFNQNAEIVFEDNTWEGPAKMTNALPDEGNGTSDNISGTGNTRITSAAPSFVDAGLPDTFDWLNLEMWTDVASLGDGSPVSYAQDEVVTHMGLAYQCALDPCPAGRVPPDHPDTWTPLGALPDDVRIAPGTEYEALGLQPHLD